MSRTTARAFRLGAAAAMLGGSACTVATVGVGGVGGTGGEGTESSMAPLTAAALRDAGGPVACGTRFVGLSGDPSPHQACRSLGQACRSIGQAVLAACPGDLVIVGAGTFTENVVIDRPLTLIGAGEATVVEPAVSAPAPCSSSSLCGGAASSVFLVRSSDVTLAGLTIEGDNPALTSGAVVRGADIDARNGIATDSGGPFDRLEVRDVTVRDVYFRGVDASSGGTFLVDNSRVANLSSDEEAIGIFDTGGAGRIEGNVVTDAPSGIAANGSRGTRIAGNTVIRAGSGIHTDNQGIEAGSSADVIEGNVVSDCTAEGFGLWSFGQYLPVTFRSNRVSRCSVGLAEFGENAPVQGRFIENVVDGAARDASVGVYVTTSLLQYGSSDVGVFAARNTIEHASVAVLVEEEKGSHASVDVDSDVDWRDGQGVVRERTP